MAQLIHSPTGSGPQGHFELKLVEDFLRSLPVQFKILPNCEPTAHRRAFSDRSS